MNFVSNNFVFCQNYAQINLKTATFGSNTGNFNSNLLNMSKTEIVTRIWQINNQKVNSHIFFENI